MRARETTTTPAHESTDDIDDVPVYLPGTPTLSFTRRLERFVDRLRR